VLSPPGRGEEVGVKRRNVQMAFVGDGYSPSDMDPTTMVDGDEAVEIDVTGGKLMVVVPAGTQDERLFEKLSVLGGELLLENGLVLSFEIKDGAVGAQFSATPVGKREDDHAGLSALPDVPGGA
jgi:hypothetical protein